MTSLSTLFKSRMQYNVEKRKTNKMIHNLQYIICICILHAMQTINIKQNPRFLHDIAKNNKY